MLNKIKNALISVSDKSELSKLVKALSKFNINIISSGGTYNEIKKLGYECTELSYYTGFEEMLDGRVKTLHPKIHAGILHDRGNQKHQIEMEKNNFPSIDLIVVNFYPFQKIVLEKNDTKKIIENIDIGGPTLVRAAAKNFENVLIITSTKDYKSLIDEIEKNKGSSSSKYRKQMAAKAFALTGYYDAMISNWFNQELNIKFPERKLIFGRRIENLRYGENPHQNASYYLSDYNDRVSGLKQIHGKELSFNNYNDILYGLEFSESFNNKNCTIIVKHASPCGVSINASQEKSFKNALASDPISAYGGIVICNYKMKEQVAKLINKIFIEVVLAKGFDPKSLAILKSKKNIRIIDTSKYLNKTNVNVKHFGNSFLMQDKNKILLNKNKIQYVTKKKPNKTQMQELEFAFTVCKFVKSNAIVITKDFSTIGIGGGQPSRLDSADIAIKKAKQFNRKKLKNAFVASDAFFPFADGVKNLIKAGVRTFIQPGGSIRDDEVIKTVNQAKGSMILSRVRHFNH